MLKRIMYGREKRLNGYFRLKTSVYHIIINSKEKNMKSKVKKILVYLVVGLLLLGNAGYVLPNVNEQAVVEAATNRKLSKKKLHSM